MQMKMSKRYTVAVTFSSRAAAEEAKDHLTLKYPNKQVRIFRPLVSSKSK